MKFVCSLTLLLLSKWSHAADRVDYLTQIKPLLAQRCSACHGSLKQEAGLRLDASQLIRQGSDSGAIAVAAKPDQSLILKRVTADHDSRMPPEGEGTPLTAQEIALLKAWIEQGLPAPEQEDYLSDPRDYWSYQPFVKPELPTTKRKDWTTNPIDQFIAVRHEQLGLSPQPQADRTTQLRRVYLDLIGLPPRRDELHVFLSDDSPEAYERVVDRLLDSPQYGERWGRHWMDVWRYSDWYGSRGINEIRYSQRHIWRWRDWIVDSLNADKGYDRMIVEMLAGDELAPADPEVLPATGFLGRNWYKFDRNVWMREMVEHTAMGFLSMSLKCARCHDHKFDPISQKEYYRFRAFFEPHDFRTDRISAETGEEKDATLGMVLKDGIARVYDKQPDAPTYLFQRGDDRYPDTEHPLTPGVIDVLGHTDLEIRPIDLPLESFFPALQPELIAESEHLAERKIEQAKQAVREVERHIASLGEKIETFDSEPKPADSEMSSENAFLHDDFSTARPDVWKPLGGDWQYRDGKLVESQVGTFLTNVTQQQHPQNFQARIRYKHLPEGAIHSVGVAFDVIDRTSWQAIYTYSSNGNSGIQAFHRDNGQEAYPAAGIVPTPVEIGQDLTVDLAVRDRDLNVWLNGELKIVYKLPLERRAGTFALWTHSGTAEFDELRIESLPDTFQLATSMEDNRKSPFHAITREDLQQQLATAMKTRQVAEQRIVIAQAERDSLFARIAAERARISEAGNFEELARKASVAEKTAKLKQAESDLLALKSQSSLDEKKLTAAKSALDQAKHALSKDGTEYTKLGEMYPRQSTGRRLALARWIADERNPRTARVAVNHIWRRHFGRGLVESLSEFGIRGKTPSHPELLDWLAAELTEHNWSMKHIHRLIVTSNTYRMSSEAGENSERNQQVDPENVNLWRMNSQRMEAEVVRDSVLHLAGALDLTRGGPEIDEKQGQTILRRSLYFRITPNESMEFLELFDLANPDECYERKLSVVPQQSLALLNSSLSLTHARKFARELNAEAGVSENNEAFVTAAFERILTRPPTSDERERCILFLQEHPQQFAAGVEQSKFPATSVAQLAPSTDPGLRARENLVHVLFSHNDFVTIR